MSRSPQSLGPDSDSPMNLTVVVLTLNEARNLRACLESVAGSASRTVVVDSGSTDDTVSIATELGADVVTHPFETHARQWQWALAQLPAGTDWVLGLDADQRLTPELREEIQRLVTAGTAANGAFVRRRQVFRGKWIRYGGYYPKYLLKLFRRNHVSVDDGDLVDHHFVVAGQTIKLQGDIIEDNRNEAEIAVWTAKHNRYAVLQARQEMSAGSTHVATSALFESPDRRVQWLKHVWRRLPLYVRPCVYVFYRYVLRLGFLDGKQGFIFHVLQGFWYRLLVDINIDELRAGTTGATRPSADRRTLKRSHGWIAAAALLVAAVWFFIYNSGLGYDALELLVIGRSISEGFPFYTFAPSKSFGLYYLVAGYVALPMASTHAGISLLITALFVLSCIATFFVLIPRFGRRSALLGSVLIGAAGIFMELNYLLPEGPLFVCGLLAFATVSAREARQRDSTWIMAGAWIGIGMAFKVVAALYAVALVTWIPLAAWLSGERVWVSSVRRIAATATGVVAALAVPAAFFWVTGRLQPHLDWTYWFPMLDYPTRTEWIAKLYTKLLWVWVVVVTAAVASLGQRVRWTIYRDERSWLLLLMGIWGLLPLLKSQASHFAFPGAAFLLLYAAVVADAWVVGHSTFSHRRLKPVAIGLAAVCLLSGAIYQPAAISRLLELRSYAQEDDLRAALQKLIPPDRRAIFFGQGLPLYWLSNRHPNWPVLHTDVQATYLLSRQATEMLSALDDPQLVLVEFDPRQTSYGDNRFFERPDGRAFLDQMHTRLQRGFRRDDGVVAQLVIWLRDPTSPGAE